MMVHENPRRKIGGNFCGGSMVSLKNHNISLVNNKMGEILARMNQRFARETW